MKEALHHSSVFAQDCSTAVRLLLKLQGHEELRKAHAQTEFLLQPTDRHFFSGHITLHCPRDQRQLRASTRLLR